VFADSIRASATGQIIFFSSASNASIIENDFSPLRRLKLCKSRKCSVVFNRKRERLLPLILVSLLKNVERSFFVFSAFSTSRVCRKVRLYFLKLGIIHKCNLLQLLNRAIRTMLKPINGYC